MPTGNAPRVGHRLLPIPATGSGAYRLVLEENLWSLESEDTVPSSTVGGQGIGSGVGNKEISLVWLS